MKLNWTKGILKNTYEIFSGGTLIGNLKYRALSSTAEGEIRGKRYLFKTTGAFKQETRIIALGSNDTIGKIKFRSWKTRAGVELGDKTWEWKYDNTWGTHWSLSDPEGTVIKYRGTSTRGDIEVPLENDLLVLAGLYVTNSYWQFTILIVIAILIPVFAATMA